MSSSSSSIDSISDPRLESLAYLEKHKLMRLFDILGAKLVYDKPDDPNAYLLTELNKIVGMVSRKQPVLLFSEQDINTMFTVFDITNKGHLNQAQYTKALNAVGISQPYLKRPVGDQIDRKTFVTSM